MKSFDDEMIVCPFNEAHRMPKPKLQWHVPKCKDKIARDQQGLPTYHCKHNWYHIFFTDEEHLMHEADCAPSNKIEVPTFDKFSVKGDRLSKT